LGWEWSYELNEFAKAVAKKNKNQDSLNRDIIKFYIYLKGVGKIRRLLI
jgi:hypothetical protein